MVDVGLEILLQYGRGRCPVHYLPSRIKEVVGINASEGSVLVSFPMEGGDKKQTLHIQWYDFKPSLAADLTNADLILCHAGAGTLLEALSLPKLADTKSSEFSQERQIMTRHRVINAVINSKLMDNHQSELAEELERRNHVLVTRDVGNWASFIGAHAFWTEVNEFIPQSFRGGHGLAEVDSTSDERLSTFQRIVDRVVGI
jgi:beta-1,4-N-acetylglucosaminyltransferase